MALADELIQARRADPRSQGRSGVCVNLSDTARSSVLSGRILAEQGVHDREYRGRRE